jgi:hypothetical protein
MIPYANATLTEILQPGNAPDWDTAAGAGIARWSGTLGVYVADEVIEQERAATLAAGGQVTGLVKTRVEIPWSVGRLVQRGDTLRWTHNETGVSWTRVVEDITGTRLIDRVRVLVEDASTGSSSAPVSTLGIFTVAADGMISDPHGDPFVPLGVNISGVNWTWGEPEIGKADEMAKWHFNTIRVNNMIRCWSGNPCNNVCADAAAAVAYLTPMVEEYTALGYVVMLTQHTYGATTQDDASAPAALADMIAWWNVVAAAFKDNPYVWFNPVNEPTGGVIGYDASTEFGLTIWTTIAETLGDAISAVAPSSVLVFDGHNAGQDKGHVSCRADQDFTYKPFDYTAALERGNVLQTRYGRNRVIMSAHFYGFWVGSGPSHYETFYPGCVGPVGDPLQHFREDANWYLDQVQLEGVPLVLGEWGAREFDAEEWYMEGSNDAAHMLTESILPTRSAPKPGLVFWHGSGLDLRYLETTQNYWWAWGGSTATLNRQGLAFYNYTTSVNP